MHVNVIPVGPGGTEKSAVRHLSAQLGAFDDQLSKAASEEKASNFMISIDFLS